MGSHGFPQRLQFIIRTPPYSVFPWQPFPQTRTVSVRQSRKLFRVPHLKQAKFSVIVHSVGKNAVSGPPESRSTSAVAATIPLRDQDDSLSPFARASELYRI